MSGGFLFLGAKVGWECVGGEDSADTQNEIAKLPDGLGAHEGQETLEPSREVRRRESKLHSKRHAPDISDLRLDERPTVGWECLAEWTPLTRGTWTPDFPTVWKRTKAKKHTRSSREVRR